MLRKHRTDYPVLGVLLGAVVGLAAALLVSVGSANAQGAAMCNGLPVTILGTSGDDDLVGTAGDDVVSLLDGDDTLDTGAGNDTVCDGAGGFTIDTGAGADTIITGPSKEGFWSTLKSGDGDDMVHVTVDTTLGAGIESGPGQDFIEVLGSGAVQVHGGGGSDLIFALEENWSAPQLIDGGFGDDQIFGWDIRGSGGDDHLTLIGAGGVAHGGGGDDRITGTDGTDVIRGGDGNDRIIARGGDDVVKSENGDDFVNGGAGNDQLEGGRGNDVLKGGTGEDRLLGEDGDDTVKGGAGKDNLIGGLGFDRLYGGSGNDAVTDRDDGAEMRGGKGADNLVLLIEDVESSIKAGPGSDSIVAVGSMVEVHGDGGPDEIRVQLENSSVYGDAGHDLVIYRAMGRGLSFFLGSGDDQIVDYPGVRHRSGIEASGGPGDDFLMGTTLDDTLKGNSGRDFLDGRPGNDSVDGGKDSDSVAGGLGRDVVTGGGDTDYCLFGHFDLVDIDDPEGIITWEGPPDRGDTGNCEETWGETGYWIYRRDSLWNFEAGNLSYEARKIGVNVYGLEADVQPADSNPADRNVSEPTKPAGHALAE